jgi:hypothetical protein
MSFLPGFDRDLPVTLADVKLAEQPSLRIIGPVKPSRRTTAVP